MSNIDQMLAATESLHASHEISEQVERSKRCLEKIIDDLPLSFAIITASGEIYKGNKAMAEHFQVPMEELIGQTLTKIFSESDWKTFSETLSASSESEKTFRLTTLVGPNKSREFLWKVQSFSEIDPKLVKLYQILGQDIDDPVSLHRHMVATKKFLDSVSSHIPPEHHEELKKLQDYS